MDNLFSMSVYWGIFNAIYIAIIMYCYCVHSIIIYVQSNPFYLGRILMIIMIMIDTILYSVQ